MGDVDTRDRKAESPAPAAPRQATVPLAYKPDPFGGPVSVRGFRLLLTLTLLNTTLLGASVLGPQLFPFLQGRWAQWQASREQEKARQAALAVEKQCLAHAVPADKVVYEEDPERVTKLLKDDPNGYKPVHASVSLLPGWVGPARSSLPDYANGSDYPLLFLHERTTPGGVHYVVAAHLHTSHQFTPVRQGGSGSGRTVAMKLETRRQILVEARLATSLGAPPNGALPFQQRAVELFLPDSQSREIVRFDGDIPVGQTPKINYGNALRFFGGQADADDAGHFTVAYQVDGRDGVIEGWVKDDGIDIRPREGAWTIEGTRQGWRLPADPPKGPATGPATVPTTIPTAFPGLTH